MISDLKSKVKSSNDYYFNKIYEFESVRAKMIMPKIPINGFSAHQEVITLRNKYTNESVIYNPNRRFRPMSKKKYNVVSECKFEDVEKNTPSDIFGRIKSKFCTTASNLSKYAKNHGLLIFKEHDPLKFTPESVEDFIGTAKDWIKEVDESYWGIVWNCNWRAGASIPHGHFNLIARNMPFPIQENYHLARENFLQVEGGDLFNSMIQTHRNLGLIVIDGTTVSMAYLTPKKNWGILIASRQDDAFFHNAIYSGADTMRSLGDSFNMAIVPEYKSVPNLALFISRGNSDTLTSDFGTIEALLGESVIDSDPFLLIKEMKNNYHYTQTETKDMLDDGCLGRYGPNGGKLEIPLSGRLAQHPEKGKDWCLKKTFSKGRNEDVAYWYKLELDGWDDAFDYYEGPYEVPESLK